MASPHSPICGAAYVGRAPALESPRLARGFRMFSPSLLFKYAPLLPGSATSLGGNRQSSVTGPHRWLVQVPGSRRPSGNAAQRNPASPALPVKAPDPQCSISGAQRLSGFSACSGNPPKPYPAAPKGRTPTGISTKAQLRPPHVSSVLRVGSTSLQTSMDIEMSEVPCTEMHSAQ